MNKYTLFINEINDFELDNDNALQLIQIGVELSSKIIDEDDITDDDIVDLAKEMMDNFSVFEKNNDANLLDDLLSSTRDLAEYLSDYLDSLRDEEDDYDDI